MIKFINKYFILSLSIVWIIIPCLRENMPLDCIEAISWGKSFSLGYNKHPPLSGWLAYIAFRIHNSDLSIYILSQVCILITCYYVYLISSALGFDRNKKYLSVLLLFGSFYFTFAAPEFNVNVLLLPLWNGFIYHIYRAIIDKKYYHFIFVGIFAALCILSKYIGGLIILSMFIYIIFNKSTFHIFKSSYFYLGIVTFLAILSPHLYWLIKNDFITFHYALKRGNHNGGLMSHLINPIHFIASQIIAMLGSIIGCLAMYGFKFKIKTLSENERFISYSFISPIAIMFLLSLIFGLKLISMWGYAMIGLLPLIIILLNNKKIVYPGLAIIISMVFYIIGISSYIYGTKYSKVPNFPGKILAKSVSDIWHKNINTKMKYVGGDVWYAGNVAVYSDGGVKSLYIDMDSKQNTWINQNDLKRHGIIILARTQPEMDLYKNIYNDLIQLDDIALNMHNKLSDNKVIFKIAIIKPI